MCECELDVVVTADGIEGVVLCVAISGSGCLTNAPGRWHYREEITIEGQQTASPQFTQ